MLGALSGWWCRLDHHIHCHPYLKECQERVQSIVQGVLRLLDGSYVPVCGKLYPRLQYRCLVCKPGAAQLLIQAEPCWVQCCDRFSAINTRMHQERSLGVLWHVCKHCTLCHKGQSAKRRLCSGVLPLLLLCNFLCLLATSMQL